MKVLLWHTGSLVSEDGSYLNEASSYQDITAHVLVTPTDKYSTTELKHVVEHFRLPDYTDDDAPLTETGIDGVTMRKLVDNADGFVIDYVPNGVFNYGEAFEIIGKLIKNSHESKSKEAA